MEGADQLEARDRTVLVVWFYVYMVVTVFIMLNVFITIIGNAYVEARDVPKTKSTLSYHPLAVFCFPVMIFKMKSAIAALNCLIAKGEVEVTTNGKCSRMAEKTMVYVSKPAGKSGGKWQGGQTTRVEVRQQDRIVPM